MSEDLLYKIAKEVGQINAKQDIQTNLLEGHGKRLTSIEHSMERRKGVKSVFVWIWGMLIGFIGWKTKGG